MFYVLVLIPSISFLLMYSFQATPALAPYLNLDFLLVKYFTFLYLLLPSIMMRFFYQKPFTVLFTMRIAILHIIILVFWLLLAKMVLLGADTNAWPAGEMFFAPFLAANIAYYFVLRLPVPDHQATETLRRMKGPEPEFRNRPILIRRSRRR